MNVHIVPFEPDRGLMLKVAVHGDVLRQQGEHFGVRMEFAQFRSDRFLELIDRIVSRFGVLLTLDALSFHP